MASKSPRWSFGGLFRLKSSAQADARPQEKSTSKPAAKAVHKPLAKSGSTSAKSSTNKPASAPSNPYHAVTIVPGRQSCAAAHRFTGQRFLSRQAPKLPLPTCDAASCTCRFKHYADRRVGPRRRDEIGMMQPPFNGSEKRRTGGRRAEDHA